ncbi:hypothetical protein L873DRAFT_116861 [Choiromyces venosus 120613-1]|uniref:Uncharacterized protein n=1 Tax=Choiromyces venosus 120613-1 TaxID=1336337 RepID=A0A3N4J3R9_9PEZI|nr:hypothetical protein L873DRAFT_116861 [Choiromyces venosus 120613-1]
MGKEGLGSLRARLLVGWRDSLLVWTFVCGSFRLFAQWGRVRHCEWEKEGGSSSWLACTTPNRLSDVGTLRRRATRPSKRVTPPTVLLRNTLRGQAPLSYR